MAEFVCTARTYYTIRILGCILDKLQLLAIALLGWLECSAVGFLKIGVYLIHYGSPF